MNKQVIVSVTGNQSYNGDSDCVELITQGIMKKDENGYTITYQETEMSGMKDTQTTLQISKECVTLLRTGETNSQMVFEKDQRHVGYYETPYGMFTIGTLSNHVDVDITDHGGRVDIGYYLEINNQRAAENNICLTVKEAAYDRPCGACTVAN